MSVSPQSQGVGGSINFRGRSNGNWPTLAWPEFGTPLCVWIVSSAITVFGGLLGTAILDSSNALEFPASFARYDGFRYGSILEEGYSYSPHRDSDVAFFPAYPLVARAVATLGPLSAHASLLIVSYASLAVAFILFGRYATVRRPAEPSTPAPNCAMYSLLAFALFPPTFFMRMAYSEAFFVAICLMTMYGIAARWPILLVALLVGLATAVRPVGVALLAPLAWELWLRSDSPREFFFRRVWILALACWGLLAYMGLLAYRFGDPFAFAHVQENWRIRPPGSLQEKALGLASFEPFWSVYLPSSPAYWKRTGSPDNLIFNLMFANPLWFGAVVFLICLGGWRRWLTVPEFLFSIALLLIPYITRSYEMCMASHARFASVVFPAYFVLGHFLGRLSPAIAISLLALCGALLAGYAALFAAGYTFY